MCRQDTLCHTSLGRKVGHPLLAIPTFIPILQQHTQLGSVCLPALTKTNLVLGRHQLKRVQGSSMSPPRSQGQSVGPQL